MGSQGVRRLVEDGQAAMPPPVERLPVRVLATDSPDDASNSTSAVSLWSVAEAIKRHSVAVVDANSHHREEVSRALLSFYRVTAFADPANALTTLSTTAGPGLIVVGEQVGVHGGIRFIKALRQVGVLNRTPVIYVMDRDDPYVAAEARAAGADDCLVKPYRRSSLVAAISACLNIGVERKWESLPALPRQALKGTVEAFNNISDIIASGEPLPYGEVTQACTPLVEAVNMNNFKAILNGVKDHDNYTYAHSMRVATLLSLFGNAAGVKGDDQLLLASGGLLHDAGKMSIPHEILNKPGRLDEAEFTIMKSHVPETVRFLRNSPDVPKSVMTIAEQHHEKLNGLGYPHGLKGAQLNELARMAAIVDVFSALTDRRVYKPPVEPGKALSIMTDEMTEHLDQRFLALFKSMLLDAVT
jgi:putative nucleotidyltransferase with HDIG domain